MKGLVIMARGKEVHLRFNDEEYEKLKASAKSVDMPLARYIRFMAMHGEVKEYNMKIVQDVRMEMRKIGTNINQIAAMVNASQVVTDVDLKSIKRECNRLTDLIEKWLKPLDFPTRTSAAARVPKVTAPVNVDIPQTIKLLKSAAETNIDDLKLPTAAYNNIRRKGIITCGMLAAYLSNDNNAYIGDYVIKAVSESIRTYTANMKRS